MGFTIGGIRDIRSGIRRRGRTADRLALAELSGRWGWDVVPGANWAGSPRSTSSS